MWACTKPSSSASENFNQHITEKLEVVIRLLFNFFCLVLSSSFYSTLFLKLTRIKRIWALFAKIYLVKLHGMATNESFCSEIFLQHQFGIVFLVKFFSNSTRVQVYQDLIPNIHKDVYKPENLFNIFGGFDYEHFW